MIAKAHETGANAIKLCLGFSKGRLIFTPGPLSHHHAIRRCRGASAHVVVVAVSATMKPRLRKLGASSESSLPRFMLCTPGVGAISGAE